MKATVIATAGGRGGFIGRARKRRSTARRHIYDGHLRNHSVGDPDPSTGEGTQRRAFAHARGTPTHPSTSSAVAAAAFSIASLVFVLGVLCAASPAVAALITSSKTTPRRTATQPPSTLSSQRRRRPPRRSRSLAPPLRSHRPPFVPIGLDRIVLPCRDVPAMKDFYVRVLGCDSVDDDSECDGGGGGGPAKRTLRAGDTYIVLAPRDEDSGGEGSEFRAFGASGTSFGLRVGSFDVETAVLHLSAAGAEPKTSTEAAEVALLTVRDPEGNVVELTTVADGKTFDAETTVDVEGDGAPVDPADGRGEQKGLAPPHLHHVENPPPPTPCVRICRYNADWYGGQVCIGFHRDAFEIGTWSSMDPSERSVALLDAADRCPPPDDDKGEGEGGGGRGRFPGAASTEELLRQAEAWGRFSG